MKRRRKTAGRRALVGVTNGRSCQAPASRSSRVEPLERGVDVVAERERDLRGALDDSRGARHRRHRLEAGDDLVARRPGGEGERHRVLERRRAASTATVAATRTSAAVLSSITDAAYELPSTAIASRSASSCTASRRRCSLYSSIGVAHISPAAACRRVILPG